MAFYICRGRAVAFIGMLLVLYCSAQPPPDPWAKSTATALPPPPSTSESTSAFPTQPSASSATTTPINVGDFIAAGFGLTRSADLVDDHETPLITETLFLTLSRSSTITIDGQENLPLSNASTADDPATLRGNRSYTLSFTGDCWQQWNQYWSAILSASEVKTWIDMSSTITITNTLASVSASTKRFSGEVTVTDKNGVFAQTTFVTIIATSQSLIYSSFPLETVTETKTLDLGHQTDPFDTITIATPSCILPSRIPQCQSSWEDWISGNLASFVTAPAECSSYVNSDLSLQPLSCQGPLSKYEQSKSVQYSRWGRASPDCTQASVTGVPCSRLISSHLRHAQWYHGINDGVVVLDWTGTTYTTTDASSGRSTINSYVEVPWDPSSSVAPGCTLGCHSCQVNGGTVQLIYWLPASSIWINGNYSAITDSGNVTRILVMLGTTLTSPTVYVSFDSLYARNSCSASSKTYFNEIVAITDSATLKSIYGWNKYNRLGEPASFNFTDL